MKVDRNVLVASFWIHAVQKRLSRWQSYESPVVIRLYFKGGTGARGDGDTETELAAAASVT